MVRFLALLVLLVVLAASNVASFSVSPVKNNKVASSIARASSTATTTSPFAAAAAAASTTTTAMHMVKIKVDPNAKEERLNPAVFKNAFYLGSVAVAVLLPVFFLIAASK